MLTADNLIDPAIRHGFFTRRGGSSEGLYASLNCGYGSADREKCVTENRRRVANALQAEILLTMHQVHSADCVTVHEPWMRQNAPKADAMVTDHPGIALGILTADCGPVLFQGRKADGAPVIGAAHAGWGGAVRGVLERTLQTMVEAGVQPGSIRAALGPCIGPQSYEVSEGFETPFIEDDSAADRFFRSAACPGYLMFDLPGYIAFRLNRAGVGSVGVLNRDTCAEEADFFSYRRSCLRAEAHPDNRARGEREYGRQISAIVIGS
jgi:YfiH family protein